MARRLALVLSDNKAKRLKVKETTAFRFTRESDEFTVVGLRGHLVEMDFPNRDEWGETDLRRLALLDPVSRIKYPSLKETLQSLAVNSDEVVIATDFDREGELIGVEALQILREANQSLVARRLRTSALSRYEILQAFDDPKDIDWNLAAAAEAREMVDLTWGATLTRFMTSRCAARSGDLLSVGRVQTPTLSLLAQREREREEFVPTPSWKLVATLGEESRATAEHMRNPFAHEDEAMAAQGRARLATVARVVSYESERTTELAPPPINTTYFLALASSMGLSAPRAMRIAEDLYQSGLISYPRTDNTVYPPSLNLRNLVERLLDSPLKKEAQRVLAQPTMKPSRGRIQTTDHPPIHPTAGVRKADVDKMHWHVFEIVARRFLATLSPPSVYLQSQALLEVSGEPFIATGKKLLEIGWKGIERRSNAGERFLPQLYPGDELKLLSVEMLEEKSKPPPRFTHGSLIVRMEELGLGTKSTRHEIIQKLYSRGYMRGRSLRPTESGRAVVEALQTHAPRITHPAMTKHLEEEMESVAKGLRSKDDVIRESRKLLLETLSQLEEHEEAIATWVRRAFDEQRYFGTCEVCGQGEMVLRKRRDGRAFLGCSRYPKCGNTRSMNYRGISEGAKDWIAAT